MEGRGLGDILSKMLIPAGWCRDLSGLQVQEFTGKLGRQRGVPSASREAASQAGHSSKHCPGDEGRNPTPVGHPALLLPGGDGTDPVSDTGTCA